MSLHICLLHGHLCLSWKTNPIEHDNTSWMGEAIEEAIAPAEGEVAGD